MANNRLYIVDRETGDRVMLAKCSMHPHWSAWPASETLTLEQQLDAWLKDRDIECACGGDVSQLVLMTEQQLIDYDEANRESDLDYFHAKREGRPI
jgi:hypothetical protein